MGEYTELFIRAEMRKDTPPEVLDILRYIINPSWSDPEILPDHPFFQCRRWDRLANSSSYHVTTTSRYAKRPEWGIVQILISGSFKNYSSEVEKFFDWIDPYIDALPGEFLGFSQFNVELPTFWHKKE